MLDYKFLRIYIAAPFFTPEEIAVVEEIEQLLTAKKISFFSPMRHGKIVKDAPEHERQAVAFNAFMMNIAGILSSTMLLHVIDHKDQGAAWENGFFIGSFGFRNPNRVIVTYTYENKPLNIMLQQPAIAHICGIADLDDFLAEFQLHGLESASRKYSDFGINLT